MLHFVNFPATVLDVMSCEVVLGADGCNRKTFLMEKEKKSENNNK